MFVNLDKISGLAIFLLARSLFVNKYTKNKYISINYYYFTIILKF